MAPATMPTRTKPKRSTMVPVRACSRCDTIDDVFHLTMVGRLWLCRECHRGLSFPGAGVGAAAEAAVTPQSDGRRELQRIDRWLRWGGFALKVAFYIGVMWLARSQPIAQHVLFGFFIADAIGWMVHAWFDARFHGHAVTTEAVFYTVAFIVMYSSGMLDLPAGVDARYLAAGTAGLALALRGANFWRRLTVQPGI